MGPTFSWPRVSAGHARLTNRLRCQVKSRCTWAVRLKCMKTKDMSAARRNRHTCMTCMTKVNHTSHTSHTKLRAKSEHPAKTMPVNPYGKKWIHITLFESTTCEQFPPKPLILNNRVHSVFRCCSRLHHAVRLGSARSGNLYRCLWC